MTDQAPPQVPPVPPQPPQEFSPAVRALGKAISQHPHPVQAAFCGISLYCEVMASDRVKMKGFLMDGSVAQGNEPEGTLVVPVLAIAGQIVLGFDPTLPPDGFRLAP